MRHLFFNNFNKEVKKMFDFFKKERKFRSSAHANTTLFYKKRLLFLKVASFVCASLTLIEFFYGGRLAEQLGIIGIIGVIIFGLSYRHVSSKSRHFYDNEKMERG